MRKSKLTREEVMRYLLALEEYYERTMHLAYLPSHEQVYQFYRNSRSKRVWRELGTITGLDRTKIYKHYLFTYTRRFHEEIAGPIEVQLNSLINQDGDILAFEKENNLHHDAVDQYVRYYKRKSQDNTPESSPLKLASEQSEGIQALLLAVLSEDAPLARLLM